MSDSEKRQGFQPENIKHHTERLPGVCRTEVYQVADIVYKEMFDDLSGDRVSGNISMYDGIHVCGVGSDGTLNMNFPTGWVFGHKEMMLLVEDIKRLDEFLSAVCEGYR